MKKIALASLLALAVGTVSAQQVTVYGILDEAVRKTDLNNGPSTTSMVSGSFYTSRIGFKGVEDLGNGLTASFNLEGKLDLSNGSTDANNLFGREASLSLSSKTLGTVTMGRTDTSDAEGIDTLAGLNNFGNFALTSGAEYSTDRANTIKYTSPSIMGATFKIGRSHTDGLKAETDSASLVYNGSNFAIGAGIDKQGSDEYAAIGGRVDLGVASVGAMYGKRDAANDVTVSALSVKVPLTAGFAAHGAYKTNEVAGSDKVITTAVGVTKTLSKRTFAHVVYQNTNKGASAGNFVQVGVVHSF